MVVRDTKRGSSVQHAESCGKPNHLSVCRTQLSKQVHVVTTEQSWDESDDSLYQLEEVGAVHHQWTKQFFTTLQVLETAGDTEIQCQLDSATL